MNEKITFSKNIKFLNSKLKSFNKDKLVRNHLKNKSNITLIGSDWNFKNDSDFNFLKINDLLTNINFFDLPFGLYQPTSHHLKLISSLMQRVFFPLNKREEVSAFLRQMYHNFSNNNMPKIFRDFELEDVQYYSFGHKWLNEFDWLPDVSPCSWYDLSHIFYEKGLIEEALISHKYAMPTMKDFVKIMKDLNNFESTPDGLWLPKVIQDAANKFNIENKNRTDFNFYGSPLCEKTTSFNIFSKNLIIDIDDETPMIEKTKIIERYIAALIVCYLRNSSFDVLKYEDTKIENLYSGNFEFDILPLNKKHRSNVLNFHNNNYLIKSVVFNNNFDYPCYSNFLKDFFKDIFTNDLSNNINVMSSSFLINDEELNNIISSNLSTNINWNLIVNKITLKDLFD